MSKSMKVREIIRVIKNTELIIESQNRYKIIGVVSTENSSYYAKLLTVYLVRRTGTDLFDTEVRYKTTAIYRDVADLEDIGWILQRFLPEFLVRLETVRKPLALPVPASDAVAVEA